MFCQSLNLPSVNINRELPSYLLFNLLDESLRGLAGARARRKAVPASAGVLELLVAGVFLDSISSSS